jgi:hypothetical protein
VLHACTLKNYSYKKEEQRTQMIVYSSTICLKIAVIFSTGCSSSNSRSIWNFVFVHPNKFKSGKKLIPPEIIGMGQSQAGSELSVGQNLGRDQAPYVHQDGDPLCGSLDPHGLYASLGRRDGVGALQSGPVGQHHRVVPRDQKEDERCLHQKGFYILRAVLTCRYSFQEHTI